MAKPWDDDRDHDRSTSLAAVLSGRGVVDEDRDTNGWGTVSLQVRPDRGQVCFTYFVRGVEDPENINVYVGRRGDPNSDADIVAELRDSGSWGSGCRQVGPRTAWAMVRSPGRYNVQVDGEDGAIRGQLRWNDQDHDW
ncbi:CHRD domain-containing protein [Virgisporangium aurantiacum]|nr:CHRD domain-containing protein [Virgisporangium aurantiacum]